MLCIVSAGHEQALGAESSLLESVSTAGIVGTYQSDLHAVAAD